VSPLSGLANSSWNQSDGFQMAIHVSPRASATIAATMRSPARYVYMAPIMEEANMTNMARLLAKSRPVGDLR